jgi:2-polyprenyl-3-methyl-5-hydroxy-6-metoxy-1,4-benzoquinol methylase
MGKIGELVDLKGISYNPFTGLFSQSQDVDVNYMVHYRRPVQAS